MTTAAGRSGRAASLGTSVAIVVALVLGGCSSGKHSSKSPAPTATRWWSNAAVKVGSTIDPVHPSAAAPSLTTSRSDYCAMLSLTKDKGQALIPAGASNDPRLVLETEALVAEIQAVAPATVAPSWKVIAPVILQVVKSGSLPSGSATSGTANLQAAEAINDDAKANCHLDLSSLVTGG
jgi:hypothetical protein